MFALLQLISLLFRFIRYAMLARIILSWIPHDPYHPVIDFLRRVTDPILEPFRRLIPPLGGMDFSPIAAFMAIGFLENIVIRVVYSLV